MINFNEVNESLDNFECNLRHFFDFCVVGNFFPMKLQMAPIPADDNSNDLVSTPQNHHLMPSPAVM